MTTVFRAGLYDDPVRARVVEEYRRARRRPSHGRVRKVPPPQAAIAVATCRKILEARVIENGQFWQRALPQLAAHCGALPLPEPPEITLEPGAFRDECAAIRDKLATEYVKWSRRQRLWHWLAKRKRAINDRRRRMLFACPWWVDRMAIRRLYWQARRLNARQGQGAFHVAHIIPLVHQDVCGLHVPWNLQILTRAENQSKSNKFAPCCGGWETVDCAPVS